jgi:glycosyltransferase involved in cell wall biosynthesis
MTGRNDGLSLTVVICTRDRPTMLARLLASVREHAPDLDVLVVDSASVTAETRTVAAEAGYRCIRLERPGLSIARNAGLHTVGSDIVAFTDDDCIVVEDWTAPLRQWFADPRVAVVTGEMVAEDGKPPAPGSQQAWHAHRTVDGLDLGHGANMAFRRSAVVELGGFDTRLGAGTVLAGAEDLDMFCRLLHAGWCGVREPRSWLLHAHSRHDAAYIRLIRGYAMGSGAALVKMLRIDAAVGTAMTLVVLRRLAGRLALLPVQRTRRATLASVAGLVAGFTQALRLPVADGVFAPEHDAGRSVAA